MESNEGGILAGIGAGVVALFLALGFFFFGATANIEAGHIGVLTTWGRVEPVTLQPGFNFKTPIAQGVTDYDIRVQKEQVKASAASKDLQDVTTEVALNFHPDAGKVYELHNQIGPDYKVRIIDPAIQEAVKATTAQYTANELVTNREEVKVKARELLHDRLARYFIVVDDLNIVNFDFSKAFNDAIDAANVARQQVITAQQTLDRQRVEAQLQVAQAEAAASATRAKADADAYATLTNAKAQAQAYQIQVQSFGSAELFVEYTQAKQWNGSVPQTILGQGSNFLFGLNR